MLAPCPTNPRSSSRLLTRRQINASNVRISARCTWLLVRHARGVTLTPSGICLLGRLDTIMHLLAAPLQQGSEDAVQGTLSLAMPAEVAPLLVPSLVAAFQRSWPQVRFVCIPVREQTGGTPPVNLQFLDQMRSKSLRPLVANGGGCYGTVGLQSWCRSWRVVRRNFTLGLLARYSRRARTRSD
jgi:hypothetical protein